MGAARRLWCNAGRGVPVSGLLDLLERLLDEDPEVEITLTASRDVTLPGALPDGIARRARPADLRQKAERFLDQEKPDVAVFTGSDLVLSAIPACKARGMPLILLNARLTHPSGPKRFWSDIRMRGRVRLFDRVFTETEADAAQFRNSGGLDDRVEVMGPLEPGPQPPPCDTDERDALAALIAARPVWSATGLSPPEIAGIEHAHRRASRISHRLLLIASPANAGDGEELAERFAASNWRVGRRWAGDEPNPDIEIYVADDPDELGLWYRLAPISFIGSSLATPGGGYSPFAPAYLGSAVLHGPYMDNHREEAQRLSRAGASTTVQTGEELGEAVIQMLSPERAARQAHRAWEVTSSGAESAARALDTIIKALDGEAV